MNDIWLVNPDRSADTMSAKLHASFEMRVARGDRYPLLWAIYDTFKFEFWLGGICQLIASVFQVIGPYTLRYLIAFANEAYFASRDPGRFRMPPIGRGVALAFIITIMQIIQSLGTNHFIYCGMIVGGQTRAVLISVIFEKAMKLSGRAKAGGRDVAEAEAHKSEDDHPKKKRFGPKLTPNKAPGIAGDGTGWGNGKIVNLMATDTYRIDQASGMFHIIWTAPLIMIITLVLLLVNLTYSALAGFGLLVLGTPLVTQAIKSLFKRRAAINKLTDRRVSLTQEILQGVRFVKYFGWETSFLKRLGDLRRVEIRAIQFLLAIRNAVNAVSMV